MEYLSGNSNDILSLFSIDTSVIVIFIISILVIFISNVYNQYMTKYRIKKLVEIQMDTNNKINEICNILSDLNGNSYIESDNLNNNNIHKDSI